MLTTMRSSPSSLASSAISLQSPPEAVKTLPWAGSFSENR
jgi:hypothetical protein